MKIVYLVSLFILLAPFTLLSQILRNEIRGKVTDKNNRAIEYAIVKVIGSQDSTSQLTDKEGQFHFRRLEGANFKVKVSFIGFKTYSHSVVLSKERPVADLGTIILEEGLDLKEVTVNAEATAIIVKKDTIEYNASSFQTQPNASVEDLLKKLPGIEVDKDGNLKTAGEDIKKVLVDGKEFFGSDPKIATKNLPADAIKKAQLIDDKTEESKARGVDDGKRDKVLNLVLKEDKKKGVFGSASLTGGTKDRYHGSLSLNHFNKDKQLNLLMLSNNVNQAGFSMDAIRDFSGGGGPSYYSYTPNGQTMINGINVAGSTAGLNTTTSGGINYSDSWGKKNKTRFTGSYFAFNSSTLQETESSSQQFQSKGTFYGNSNSWRDNSTETHRFNVRLTASPDSLTTISLSPSLSLNFRNGESKGSSNQSNQNGIMINESTSNSSDKSFSPTLNGSYSVNRRFRNKKGNLSLYINNNYNSSESSHIGDVENNYYQISRHQRFNREDQRDYVYSNLSVNGTISRTASKDKKAVVFFSPKYSVNTNNSNLDAFEYNPSSGFYEIRVDSLTNDSKSKTQRFTPEIGFNKNTEKWSMFLSAGFQRLFLSGDIYSRGQAQQISKNYSNIIPSFYIRYAPKKGTSIDSYLGMDANAPNISDLQLLQNNTSPMYIYSGNPDLKASKHLNSRFSFRKSDIQKGTFSYVSVSYNRTFDAATRSTTIDTLSGIRYARPVNISGNYNLNLNGGFMIPTKLKGLKITPGFTFMNSRNRGFVDNLPNNSLRVAVGPNLNFSYSYKEILDIGFNNRSTHTWVDNSVSSQSARDRKYFNFDNGGNLSVRPIKKWRINTDLTHRSYAGQNFALFNAGIQRSMLSKDKLTLELKGFDLLNKNSDVNRYVGENYLSDSRSNNLNRYFYLRLTYKVTKVGARSGPTPPPPVIVDISN